ncbi:MAG: pyridoxal-dependent decarboxylase [Gammaproteobacteria bacterium]|nr:pyridoxal-dependent decarboxylase [Gammaproteobacteria bacterium]
MTAKQAPELLYELLPQLGVALERAYSDPRPIGKSAALPGIPDDGIGTSRLPELWQQIVDGSTKLASPWMIGHMDTAPHPAAALTDALVSGLNNNLLFRELSPIASDIEEILIAEFAERLGLPVATVGNFCSGGSLANLTALFAACGGYTNLDRSDICIWCAVSAHTSIGKAASVLGIPPQRVMRVAVDAAGRLDVVEVRNGLARNGAGLNIVVGVAGGTVTGAIDNLVEIGELCAQFSAWFHVDAVYGGALMYSDRYRDGLNGIAAADSIALGPQKWFYVPRLCALTLFPDRVRFESTLATPMPYSAGARAHRGTWGLQGSRRADAVTLWVLLQALGRRGCARLIDDAIDLTHQFYDMLMLHPRSTPLHEPDLNVQVFRWGSPDRTGERMLHIQAELEADGQAWLSISEWGGEYVLRAVLLNPGTRPSHLDALLASLQRIDP